LKDPLFHAQATRVGQTALAPLLFVAKDLGRNRSDDTGFSAAWQSRLRLDGPPAPRGIVSAARLTLL
jgi:hypothetical protein